MDLSELIAQAYAEDIPDGDLTTANLRLEEKIGDAKLVAKEDLVLSGRELFTACVHHMSPKSNLRWQFEDGGFLLKGQVACWIRGNLLELLRAERVALNFLGHLSGIATLTRCFVQETKGTKTRILDTRKTTPLLRGFEKRAVKDGGGTNHRMNLSDAVLIKENHIRAAGGMTEAIRRIRRVYVGPIEVECSTLEEVEIAAAEDIQRILLDNMSNEQMQTAVEKIRAGIETEASGNMNLARIASAAATGVDYISVGALTHSAPCADLSLLFDWEPK